MVLGAHGKVLQGWPVLGVGQGLPCARHSLAQPAPADPQTEEEGTKSRETGEGTPRSEEGRPEQLVSPEGPVCGDSPHQSRKNQRRKERQRGDPVY